MKFMEIPKPVWHLKHVLYVKELPDEIVCDGYWPDFRPGLLEEYIPSKQVRAWLRKNNIECRFSMFITGYACANDTEFDLSPWQIAFNNENDMIFFKLRWL